MSIAGYLKRDKNKINSTVPIYCIFFGIHCTLSNILRIEITNFLTYEPRTFQEKWKFRKTGANKPDVYFLEKDQQCI